MINKTVKVTATPIGIWTLVDLIWTAPMRVQFTAKNQKWNYSPVNACGADGDLLSTIDPARTILGSGPVGALIGKIGGSSAGVKDGQLTFLVGQFLAFETKADCKGPLYLTINDEPKGLSNNAGEIEVDVVIDTP